MGIFRSAAPPSPLELGTSGWTSEQAAAHWSKRARDFDAIHPRLRVIRQLLNAVPEPVASLLDVGCGPAALRRLLPPDVEYFGVDIAAPVIQAHGDPAHFEVADVDVVDRCFGGREFDVVVCSGVFEYSLRPQHFLEVVQRQVRPGGHLIFSYTNHQHCKDGLGWLRGRYADYRDPHANFMLVPELRRRLNSIGFRTRCWTTLTRTGRRHPLLGGFMRYPFNMVNRQYVFLLCRPPPLQSG